MPSEVRDTPEWAAYIKAFVDIGLPSPQYIPLLPNLQADTCKLYNVHPDPLYIHELEGKTNVWFFAPLAIHAHLNSHLRTIHAETPITGEIIDEEGRMEEERCEEAASLHNTGLCENVNCGEWAETKLGHTPLAYAYTMMRTPFSLTQNNTNPYNLSWFEQTFNELDSK